MICLHAAKEDKRAECRFTRTPHSTWPCPSLPTSPSVNVCPRLVCITSLKMRTSSRGQKGNYAQWIPPGIGWGVLVTMQPATKASGCRMFISTETLRFQWNLLYMIRLAEHHRGSLAGPHHQSSHLAKRFRLTNQCFRLKAEHGPCEQRAKA